MPQYLAGFPTEVTGLSENQISGRLSGIRLHTRHTKGRISGALAHLLAIREKFLQLGMNGVISLLQGIQNLAEKQLFKSVADSNKNHLYRISDFVSADPVII